MLAYINEKFTRFLIEKGRILVKELLGKSLKGIFTIHDHDIRIKKLTLIIYIKELELNKSC